MATNDLADLKTKLATALRDSSNNVWSAAELGNLLTWATASLFPRVVRGITKEVASVDDQEVYDWPDTTMREISQIDWLDSNDNMILRLGGGSWETQGDVESGSGKLFINRVYSDGSHSFRVHGYGVYDLTTNLPPDRYIPLILARARAEAYRRALGDRSKFQKWQALNQTQNVSVNEMIQMVNEADNEAERLGRMAFTWRKPKPA